MATKTAKAAKKPTKPTKKGATGKLVKVIKPTTKAVTKPTPKAKAKPTTAKVTKPPTSRTAKVASDQIVKTQARHDKPGTGRVDRTPTSDRPATGARKAVATATATPAVKFGASPFSRDELRAWRQTLLEHRSEISQDIQHLEHDAMEAEDGHTTPNHIAERGSDAEMQDMSLGLAGQEQVVLWQIDRALRKIDSGVPAPFGVCEHNGQAIPKTRLQLIPWTPVSIEGMNYVEDNGLTVEDILVDG